MFVVAYCLKKYSTEFGESFELLLYRCMRKVSRLVWTTFEKIQQVNPISVELVHKYNKWGTPMLICVREPSCTQLRPRFTDTYNV